MVESSLAQRVLTGIVTGFVAMTPLGQTIIIVAAGVGIVMLAGTVIYCAWEWLSKKVPSLEEELHDEMLAIDVLIR